MSTSTTDYALKSFYEPLNSSKQRLVPTSYLPFWHRDTDTYKSSERLPDVEAIFDRILNQVRQIHEVRQRNPNEFGTLWNQVCTRLMELKSGYAYAHWKLQDIVRNMKEFGDLDLDIAEELAKLEVVSKTDESITFTRTNYEKIEELQERRRNLKPVVRGAIDDSLEVVIAYWIEARNAHNSGDPLRALHCLIECHFFLGITYSPKTDYEAKSEAGRKAGQKERDALAGAVLNAMSSLDVDRSVRDEEVLRGRIFELIQSHPVHAQDLAAYDAWATKGKPTEDALPDRFSEVLRKWVTGKNPPYPQVATLYRSLCGQIEGAAISRKKPSRKANS